MRNAQILVLFVAVTYCPLRAHSAIGQAKIVEKDGGFSYTAPKDWSVKTMPGLKYKIALGPVTDGFAVNINVVDERFAGTVAQYSKANQVTLGKRMPGYKKISESGFTTTSKLKGVKLVITSAPQGRRLGQTFYFFPAKNNMMLVVTCSSMLGVAPKYARTFDDTMKSFAVK